MPGTIPVSLFDSSLAGSTAGSLAVSSGPNATPLFDDRLMWNPATAEHIVSGATIKPDTKPIHFRTTGGLHRENLVFTMTTNGGHLFTDGIASLVDDIVYWGWNLGGDFNPNWDPTKITWYDSMESGYLTTAGQTFAEWNLEGTFAGWPDGPRRWRSFAVDRSNGHGAILFSGDYFLTSNNSNTFVAFAVGNNPSYRILPAGVYEVERTAGGSGYTDGTGYVLIFSGGDGFGASGTFDVVDGAVSKIYLSTPGQEYTTAPTVSFANAGAGTGATASVILGSVSVRLPLNSLSPIGASSYVLTDSAGANREQLVAALNSDNGSIYSGFNLTEVSGVYQTLITGASSGVAYSSSGGIRWFSAGSQVAGTTLTPVMRLSSTGGLTLSPIASTTYLAVTLPASQTDTILNFVKPSTGAPVFQVTALGYVGNNAGSGVTAPGDFTRIDQGNMLQLGANGVKSLFVAEYNSGQVNLKGSAFGPFQLMSGAAQDINLIPTTTGKIGLKGPITVTDAKDFTFGTLTGSKFGTSATQKLGFFGATPIAQPTMGAATAGATYTANEQTMLQAAYNALRTLGLGS